MRTLQGPEWRLLILDGAPNEDAVREWVPYGGGCHTLVTSWFTNWSKKVPKVAVPEFDPDVAVAFLIRQTGRPDNMAERAAARLLTDRIGGRPLALQVAASYIEAHKVPFDKYALLVSHDRGSQAQELDVLRPSVKQVGPLAKAIFRTAAFLAVDAVPVCLLVEVRERLMAAATALGKPAGGQPPTEFDIRKALSELQSYSLGTYDTTTFAVHPRLREVQASDLDADEAPIWQGIAVAVLNAAFPDGTEDPAAWLEYAPVIGGIDPGDERLASAPAFELAMLHFNLGNLHRKMMSNLDRAKVFFDKGFEKHWGRADPPPLAKTASRVYRYYGDLLRLLGEVEAARAAYRTALEYKQKGPVERGKVLSSVAELCARYATEPGHLDDAKAAALESLNCQLQTGEPFEVFQSHRVLADVHVALGEPDPALGHVVEAKDFLDRAAKDRGLPRWDCHPHAGWLLRSEGESHQLRGDHATARDLFLRAYDVFDHHRHPAGQAVALKKIASAEFGLGNIQEAIRRLDDALQESAALRGERYLRVAILLARVHAGLGATGPDLAPLLDEARGLLADAAGAPTELGRVLVRRTQAGYRANRPTTLAAFASELARTLYEQK